MEFPGQSVPIRSFLSPQMFDPRCGDGILDCDVLIQDCIDSAFSDNIGCVYFPEGQYPISTGMSLHQTSLYKGNSHGFPNTSARISRGATLVWKGGLTGEVVLLNDSWGSIWDGINIEGNLLTNPLSTVVGINCNTTPTGNWQRNYFRNFVLYNLDRGMTFGKDFPLGGNQDGWVIENFWMYVVNTGIFLNAQTIAYSEIRSGAISPMNVGINFNRAGHTKVQSVDFGGVPPFGPIGANFYITNAGGIVNIESCQGESGTPGWKFAVFAAGGPRSYPTSIKQSWIGDIEINSDQDIMLFEGNLIVDAININGNNTTIKSLANKLLAPGAFVDLGAGNVVTVL